MSKVGKKEIVEAVKVQLEVGKTQAEEVVDAVVNSICEALVENDSVTFVGKFTLEKVLRKGRKGEINGVPYDTEDKYVIKGKAGSHLDRAINK